MVAGVDVAWLATELSYPPSSSVGDDGAVGPLICFSQVSKSTPLIVLGGLRSLDPSRVGVEDLILLLVLVSESESVSELKFPRSGAVGRIDCPELEDVIVGLLDI